MKKYLAVVSLGLLTLALTGCGEIKRTLVCTMTDEDLSGFGTTESEILLKYEGEKIIEGKENVYITLSDEFTPDMVENVKENLELQYENSNLNLKKWNVKVNGNKISVLTEMNIDELSDPEIDIETPYEDAKAIMQERGYNCK